jgi:hypothetical protein
MAKYVGDVSAERIAELEAEFGTEQARKMAALELAKGMPGLITEEAAAQRGLFETAATEARQGIRGQAARALAGSLAQAGTIGGAGFAQGRQTAIETGEAIGTVDAQLARDLAGLSGARMQAAQAELEALQFEAEMPTPEEEAQQLIDSYKPRIDAIISKYKGALYEDDDEQAMAREIERLAANEQNPQVREWLLRESLGVQDKGPHARDV